MLTIQECRKALNKGEKTYSDEQIRQIRDLLWMYAEIQVKTLNQQQNEIDQGDHLHKGIDR